MAICAAPTAGELPAIAGIGDSLIYFIDPRRSPGPASASSRSAVPDRVPGKGFLAIDHLTNNVPRGELEPVGGVLSRTSSASPRSATSISGGRRRACTRSRCARRAARSASRSTRAPRPAARSTSTSRSTAGPGIQHLAFLTDDILGSLRALEGTPIEFLDIDDDYYREVFERVPNVREDHAELARRDVLVDGDSDGYLLQIFTQQPDRPDLHRADPAPEPRCRSARATSARCSARSSATSSAAAT